MTLHSINGGLLFTLMTMGVAVALIGFGAEWLERRDASRVTILAGIAIAGIALFAWRSH